MISTTLRIARMIVLASFALSSIPGAATCSNASLSGTYGFLHLGTDSNGTPATAAVSQIKFDATTGTFTGETTASHGGVIATSLSPEHTQSPRTAPARVYPREAAPSQLWLRQRGSWPFTFLRRDLP